MADVDKKTSWWGRNAGQSAAAVGDTALLAGAALAPATFGLSIPAGIAVGAASQGAGWLFDKWRSKRRLADATTQWRSDSQDAENEAVHNGSMYGGGGGLNGMISDFQDMSKGFKPPAPAT